MFQQDRKYLKVYCTYLDNFGCKVFGCAAERPSSIRYLFGKPKISDLDVAVSVQEKVFRLQISVDNGKGM